MNQYFEGGSAVLSILGTMELADQLQRISGSFEDLCAEKRDAALEV